VLDRSGAPPGRRSRDETMKGGVALPGCVPKKKGSHRTRTSNDRRASGRTSSASTGPSCSAGGAIAPHCILTVAERALRVRPSRSNSVFCEPGRKLVRGREHADEHPCGLQWMTLIRGVLWVLFGVLVQPVAWRDFFPVAEANTPTGTSVRFQRWNWILTRRLPCAQ
jgi:hypothetical protein